MPIFWLVEFVIYHGLDIELDMHGLTRSDADSLADSALILHVIPDLNLSSESGWSVRVTKNQDLKWKVKVSKIMFGPWDARLGNVSLN